MARSWNAGDPGRRAIEMREPEWVAVGDRVLTPTGVELVVTAVAPLRARRLHGDTETELLLDEDEPLRVRAKSARGHQPPP